MTIAYIMQARMPTEKAHGLQIAHMCDAFAELKHEVTLYVPDRGRGIIKESVFAYYGLPERFRVSYLWAPDLVTRWGKWGWVVHWLHSGLFLVRLLFLRLPKDTLVYTRNVEIAWLFKKRGFTVVCEIHDWPESREWAFLHFVADVDVLPCNSPGTLEACRKHGLLRTLIAHNGIEPRDFAKTYESRDVRAALSLPLDAKIAMYIGSLERWKGAETLCAASAYLPGDVIAVIIGGAEAEVARMKKQYPQVYFLGQRPYRELPKNQSAADVLVVPNIPESRESVEYTSPIKLFAHMASGVPIVASDLPSIRAILPDSAGYFTTPGDPVLLAEKIREALSDTGRRAHAERARLIVREYTWKSRAERILGRVGESPR